MGYWYLVVAILSEVVATSALNASQGFTRLWPSMVTVVGYCLAFYFLSLTLRTVPMGIAYAVWAGAGIVLIAISGAIFFKQLPDLPAVLGMLFIIVGVVLVSAVSRTAGH
ncbi:MAG: SMR family transporter [Alloalcanivorax venustensis]|jgi:small multidrug resistance pump|uniref:DMT family transporter n=1 Tax=Alloalcanivorax TaxID=3020832 RepID=UPI00082EE4CF|nr:QacE family quaternary ammonium compound efflux SMR transporter [Alcanivorax sp.]MCH9784460.1 QacE family quaternary ammonium compound efflux SMR transporter [Gammaproteobacteria bacterium]MEA3261513.1 SMR family transporter [Pseudomonadota bacterium]SMO82766.1 small multidrug resistance pump [Alcanivorax sp. DSM 26295]MAQ35190.1 QacE family quaternary ammonium compound efflux SMR transporter [Alcanivorax sp.]|tara:strand:+ start:98285 stop:98614 length:330 start_codon:yes stop_codon:yes gene_type:complete